MINEIATPVMKAGMPTYTYAIGAKTKPNIGYIKNAIRNEPILLVFSSMGIDVILKIIIVPSGGPRIK